MVSAWTRGVEPVRTCFGQEGRGFVFHKFVQTPFMDGPECERIKTLDLL